MKETYWNSETISQKAQDMLHGIGGRSQGSKVFMPDVKHAALLVLDMQQYFLSPDSHAFIPSASAIIPGIKTLISFFLKHERPVILTQHLNDPADAGMMSQWWGDLIIDTHPGSNLIDELQLPGVEVMKKSQYDAFYETGLARHLYANHVRQIVVTGVMTHLCCETTSRSAFVQGFNVFLPVDGTATYNELFHRSSMINLSHGFATLVTINQLIDKLGMP
ncbi:isochorismatase family protein [bacterium]|nr:isochorismatase family protein [bacterium]